VKIFVVDSAFLSKANQKKKKNFNGHLATGLSDIYVFIRKTLFSKIHSHEKNYSPLPDFIVSFCHKYFRSKGRYDSEF